MARVCVAGLEAMRRNVEREFGSSIREERHWLKYRRHFCQRYAISLWSIRSARWSNAGNSASFPMKWIRRGLNESVHINGGTATSTIKNMFRVFQLRCRASRISLDPTHRTEDDWHCEPERERQGTDVSGVATLIFIVIFIIFKMNATHKEEV